MAGGTTSTITTLFTDIVGSTDLLARLGPQEGDDAFSRHFSGLRNALAVHRGEEVKTLGDGIMAVFASATDGLACAVTIQQTVARHNRERPEQSIGLRVGLSTGEAMREADDYRGLPVVEASRLCDSAGPGQILAADIVRLLAGSAGLHRFEPVGYLDLKGLPAALTACSVEWDAEEDTALRVAIAEDSALLREGIARVLEAEGIDVVLQTSDADSLIDGIEAVRPHVALLDVRMPPTHTTEGLDAAEHIRATYPGVGVLVLSAAVQASAARRLLHGATDGVGYLLKERVADGVELANAIRTIASGGSAIDPEVLAQLTA